jgi:hypothetical protein
MALRRAQARYENEFAQDQFRISVALYCGVARVANVSSSFR